MIREIESAFKKLEVINIRTPLQLNERLSSTYAAKVYLKREDLQIVRSYKIRGAYNKISSLNEHERSKGIVCASAGNHAQGVAFSCNRLGIHAAIFMPANTPQQKIDRVRKWGMHTITLHLTGESFDECYSEAASYATETGKPFVHPFDDEKVIAGQGTIGMELTDELPGIEYVIVPVGGGGLAAGIGAWFSEVMPSARLIAVEPQGAASLTAAMKEKQPIKLGHIDPFVDGAAVKQIGTFNFPIIQRSFHDVQVITEGKVCQTLLELYNEEAIIAEPAGALSIAALDDLADEIKGKTIVCIVSGGNNDFRRMEEIRKLAEAWEGLHHHLIIRFKHYPDGLTQLFTEILGSENYVTRLEYKRREHGRSTYALVGIKSGTKAHYNKFLQQMDLAHIEYKEVEREDFLFKYWV